MEIRRGQVRLQMSGRQTYQPEQLLRRALPAEAPPASPLAVQPIYVVLEGKSVRLNSRAEIELACKLVCIHHNAMVDEMSEEYEEETTEEETEEDTEEEEESDS